MFQVGFNCEVEVLSAVDGYIYLQPNKDLVVSLEKLFSTDLFSMPYLKSIREIDLKNIYLATYKPNIKGRVKVIQCIGQSQVPYNKLFWSQIYSNLYNFHIIYSIWHNFFLQKTHQDHLKNYIVTFYIVLNFR